MPPRIRNGLQCTWPCIVFFQYAVCLVGRLTNASGFLVAIAFAGCTRMYPEKERVPVTWADACLTASFFAPQKILRFALFAAAVFLPFETCAMRRSMSSCRGTRTRFKHGHYPYLVSSETVRRKTGHQDGTVAVRVTASGLCWLASLARALYRESASANDLSDQLIFPLRSKNRPSTRPRNI